MKTIKVTQKDIDAANKWRNAGAKGSWGKLCPIGRAVTRSLNSKKIWVGHTNVEIGTWPHILPIKAQKFIESWDNELDVEPFSFKLS